METEANKEIVRRYMELWNTGNLALADEVIAQNFIDHTHPELAPGPEAVKREVTAFRAAFPNAHGTIEQLIGEGDIVAFRFVLRGTHQGPFAGFLPTGKATTLTGMDFIRIVDSKLVELWSCQDTLTWLQQLGLKLE